VARIPAQLLYYLLWFDIPRWSRQHSWLAESTAASTATPDFNRQSVVYRFHVRY
jgi:hypothetical protein